MLPSPNELMFLLTSSLLSKKMVSSNPRLGRDQGPDNIAKRLLLLDGYLEDAAKSFRELREVQVLHILAHPTRYSIAPKKLPSELLWAMKWLSKKNWNLNRSRTFCLQQALCWRDIVLHNSDSYFAQSACIIIQLFSFWVTLASFFPSLDPSCPIGIGCPPSSRVLDLEHLFHKVHVWQSTLEQLNIFAEASLRAVILKAKGHNQM